MNSKSKIVAAIAAGAVAITVGAGAARCSLSDAEGPDAQQASQGQAAENGGNAQSGQHMQQGQESQQQAEQGGFASLANTSWTSEDGASQLSITKEALIERTPEGASVIYYEVTGESTDTTGLSVAIDASESAAEPGAATVMRVEEKAGALTLTCDLLEATYVEDARTETSLSLSGDIGDLCLLSGKSADDFRETLESFAQARSPYATKVTWDKEVWIDYGARSTLTTFTLDDAASTIVTVTVSQDGAMEAM